MVVPFLSKYFFIVRAGTTVLWYTIPIRKQEKGCGDGDELMYEMIDAGLSTKMLRNEWRAVRSRESGKSIDDATKTCYADAVGRKISCSDSETFEEIVNILRSAGYEVCGV